MSTSSRANFDTARPAAARHAGVHWHEGQFLEPHHFQAADSGHRAALDDLRRLVLPYPYGLIELDVSTDALAAGRLQVRRLRAVMRSGRVVSVPDAASMAEIDASDRLDLDKGPVVVRLALPLFAEGRSNTAGALVDESEADASSADGFTEFEVDSENPPERRWVTEDASDARRLFGVTEASLADENTGDDERPILLRRLNARLLLPDDDDAGFETLPLFRVHSAGRTPSLDPDFAPPCLTISGSPQIGRLVAQLADLVEGNRRKLVRQMARESFSFDTIQGQQFEQQVRLRTLNRSSARLKTLVTLPTLPPLQVWMELRDLLAEMAARFPAKDEELFDVPAYDHDDPAASFRSLDELLRPLLGHEVKIAYRALDFFEDDGVLATRLAPADMTADTYYLGIRRPTGPNAPAPEQVVRLVTDAMRFKVMSGRQRHTARYGVRCKEDRRPPVELPPDRDWIFFELQVRDGNQQPVEMWQEIAAEGLLAVRFPEMAAKPLKMRLFLLGADDEASTASGAVTPPTPTRPPAGVPRSVPPVPPTPPAPPANWGKSPSATPAPLRSRPPSPRKAPRPGDGAKSPRHHRLPEVRYEPRRRHTRCPGRPARRRTFRTCQGEGRSTATDGRGALVCPGAEVRTGGRSQTRGRPLDHRSAAADVRRAGDTVQARRASLRNHRGRRAVVPSRLPVQPCRPKQPVAP